MAGNGPKIKNCITGRAGKRNYGPGRAEKFSRFAISTKNTMKPIIGSFSLAYLFYKVNILNLLVHNEYTRFMIRDGEAKAPLLVNRNITL